MNEKLSLSQSETARTIADCRTIKYKTYSLMSRNLESKIQELNRLNNNLFSINESLGLDDADIVEQLEAIKQKNTELALANDQLELSKNKISEQLKTMEELNKKLVLNESRITKSSRTISKTN